MVPQWTDKTRHQLDSARSMAIFNGHMEFEPVHVAVILFNEDNLVRHPALHF
jgi:hypothetical protein